MKNNFDAVEEERMAEQLVWYSMHKHEVLDSYDHFLARYDVSQIHLITRAMKRNGFDTLMQLVKRLRNNAFNRHNGRTQLCNTFRYLTLDRLHAELLQFNFLSISIISSHLAQNLAPWDLVSLCSCSVMSVTGTHVRP